MAFLLLANTLAKGQVFSIRSAGPIGKIIDLLINPNNLKIEAFYCKTRAASHTQLLLTQDVRQVLVKGLIIDDHEHLSDPDDLPRLKQVLDIDYQLINKKVRQGNRKLGTVTDFVIDQQTFFITKLYVQPGLLKRLDTSQLVIARQQIVEVNDDEIVVSDNTESAHESVLKKIAQPKPSLSNSANAATIEE